MNTKITMGNDEFILYIRKWHSKCETITSQLGKEIWVWLKTKGAVKSPKKPNCSYWDKSDKVNKDMLPKHATQFEFDRSLLPNLYDYLDYIANKK